jgi:uncharacterized protein YkwD
MAVPMALPRSPRPAAAVLALTAVVALSCSAPSQAATAAPCAATDVAAPSAPAETVGRAIRCLVNAQRATHGLKPLRARRQLRVAAEGHGADMVAHRFFAHVSPLAGAVTDRARRSGYITPDDDYVLGEDIAWGEGELSTPAAIVTAWMNSPEHRAVILDRDFVDMGVGVIAGVPVETELAGATFVLDVGAK